ncbi:MAG TPA: alpha/beta hydrolase [Steroidobacteraceae bacterium]|nr:alpha/beta hydrolase [Steroidobacteraceae bacterium]
MTDAAGPVPRRGPGPAFSTCRLIVAGAVVFAVVAGGFIATWAIQRYVTFPSPPAGSANPAVRATVGGELVWLDADGDRVEAWLLPARNAARRALVIYAHGNGELIDMRAADFDAVRAAGYSVLQVEYPGYGRSAGSPSEASLTAALVAAYDWAARSGRFDAPHIVGHGRSLGGGAIAQLAARRPLAALVLESTFVNLEDVVMAYGVPRPLLLYHFDTAAVLRAYPGPVLLLHGTGDRVFPSANARRLATIAKDATLHLEACGHADCPPQWELVLGFLARNGV